MKHARDLEEGVADLRARVEQGRIDDREPSGADGTQPARAAVPAKLRERRAAVGGGEIDVGVESLEEQSRRDALELSQVRAIVARLAVPAVPMPPFSLGGDDGG